MKLSKKTTNHEKTEQDASSWFAALDKENLLNIDEFDLDILVKQHKGFAAWLAESDANHVAFLQLIYVWKHEAIGNVFETKVVKVKSKRSIFFAMAATILFTALPTIHYFKNTNDHIYETSIGAREIVALADGSTVELNSGSKISAAITDDERVITLSEGEVFFDIAHKEGQPFRVLAGQQVITVLGTKFSVQKKNDGIKVIVREGKVQVDYLQETEGSEVAILTAGSIAVTDSDEIIVTHHEEEVVEQKLSWRHGLITFDGSTLEEAADEFNRYNKIKIQFDDDISTLKISGQFESENYDAFLRLLSNGYGLKISYANDQYIIKISS